MVQSHSIKHRSQTFKDLLENETLVDADFDVDQLKSRYFEEKYNLEKSRIYNSEMKKLDDEKIR